MANGVNPSDIGRKTRKMVVPEFGKIVKEKKRVTGEILHMGGFGNVETKIAEKDIEGIRVSHGSSLKVDDV